MSLQSQTRNMKLLADLLEQDLGYIFGERENGPNGAKKDFLSTGKTFLTGLGRDAGLARQKVYVNSAGIGVSGEVYLCGMWETCGVKLELSQDNLHGRCLKYKRITDLRDTSGGYSHYITHSELRTADYITLLEKILILNEDGVLTYGRKAA